MMMMRLMMVKMLVKMVVSMMMTMVVVILMMAKILLELGMFEDIVIYALWFFFLYVVAN